jgi:ornithine cyclodeaminase
MIPYFTEEEVLSRIERSYAHLEAWATEAYQLLHAHRIVLPEEAFLFPQKKRGARFISMACIVEGKCAAHKWISSFPENIKKGLARGSAVLAINELESGFPLALFEAGAITRYRTVTAAIAVLRKCRPELKETPLALIGCGALHRTFAEYWLRSVGRPIEWVLYDKIPSRAKAFGAHLVNLGCQRTQIRMAATPRGAMLGQSVVSIATSAGAPHINSLTSLAKNSTVLHISLRDLSAASLEGAWHITDHVEHALSQKTSLELAVKQGRLNPREIATCAQVLFAGRRPPPGSRVILSPFGLAALDAVYAWNLLLNN